MRLTLSLMGHRCCRAESRKTPSQKFCFRRDQFFVHLSFYLPRFIRRDNEHHRVDLSSTRSLARITCTSRKFAHDERPQSDGPGEHPWQNYQMVYHILIYACKSPSTSSSPTYRNTRASSSGCMTIASSVWRRISSCVVWLGAVIITDSSLPSSALLYPPLAIAHVPCLEHDRAWWAILQIHDAHCHFVSNVRPDRVSTSL